MTICRNFDKSMGKKKGKTATSTADGSKLVDANKTARRDYEIVDRFEAGIVLCGSEVKSIRNNGVSLRDSYVRLKGKECYLVDAHIAPYTFAGKDAHDPYQDRKLLLNRKEIDRLSVQSQAKGLTIVPMSIYFNSKGRCKLEIGLGRGKKLHDKRQDLKAREAKRDMDRADRNESY